MEDLGRVAEVDGDGAQRRPVRPVETTPGCLDEEVQQHRVVVGGHDQQVTARGQPGEQGLRDARRQHSGDRGVDGVAPRPQHRGARFRGGRMTGGHRAAGGLGRGRHLSPVSRCKPVHCRTGVVFQVPRPVARDCRERGSGKIKAPWRASRRGDGRGLIGSGRSSAILSSSTERAARVLRSRSCSSSRMRRRKATRSAWPFSAASSAVNRRRSSMPRPASRRHVTIPIQATSSSV